MHAFEIRLFIMEETHSDIMLLSGGGQSEGCDQWHQVVSDALEKAT
jgi:hypothetical protein